MGALIFAGTYLGVLFGPIALVVAAVKFRLVRPTEAASILIGTPLVLVGAMDAYLGVASFPFGLLFQIPTFVLVAAFAATLSPNHALARLQTCCLVLGLIGILTLPFASVSILYLFADVYLFIGMRYAARRVGRIQTPLSHNG